MAYVFIHGTIASGIPAFEPAVHNDDWVNSLVVKGLCEEGRFRMHPLAGAFAVPQILAGWAWCQAAGGFSFSGLRTMMVLHGIAPVWLLWRLLRRLDVASVPALLGAVLFAVNPITVSLTWSFQTDLVYLSLVLAALLVTVKADAGRGMPGPGTVPTFALTGQTPVRSRPFRENLLVLAAAALLVLAFLTRQSAVLVTAGVAGYWALRRRWLWAGCTLATVPLMVSVEHWLIRQSELTYLPWVKGQLGRALGDWSVGRLIFWSYETLHVVLFLGLLLLPLLIGTRPKGRLGWRSLTGLAFLLTSGVLVLDALVQRTPLLGNYVYAGQRYGIGPATLGISAGDPFGVSQGGQHSALLAVLSLAALVGGGLMLEKCGELVVGSVRAIRRWSCDPPFLADLSFWATLAGTLAASVLIGRAAFDRYVWLLLPLSMPLCLRGSLAVRRVLIVGVPVALLWAVVSVAGVIDYWRWNEARWEALSWLESQGVEPARIDGGYEYNALRDLLALPPEIMTDQDRQRRADIETLRRRRPVYCVRFVARPGEHVAARFAYETPIYDQPQFVIVGRQPPSN